MNETTGCFLERREEEDNEHGERSRGASLGHIDPAVPPLPQRSRERLPTGKGFSTQVTRGASLLLLLLGSSFAQKCLYICGYHKTHR